MKASTTAHYAKSIIAGLSAHYIDEAAQAKLAELTDLFQDLAMSIEFQAHEEGEEMSSDELHYSNTCSDLADALTAIAEGNEYKRARSNRRSH